MRHVLTYEGDSTLNVPPTGGVMQLRQAIAKHLYEFRGITVNPEQIIIGAGTRISIWPYCAASWKRYIVWT